jgi:hypothetical protein
MATAAVVLPRLRARPRVRARARRVSLPIENLLIFAIACAFYAVVANYFVFHLNYMINDAVTRVDNAFDVLYSRDPHLGAIGFFWGPLPSFFDLPILAFKGIWPALASKAFAGSIEAAAFGAGTVVLFNVGLRWAGVIRPMRYIICAVWMINPMITIYSAQGMAEAPFMFFFVAATIVFLRWAESRRTSLLPLMGLLAGAAALCRNEALLFAFAMGVAVIVMSIRHKPAGWRQVETEALLYGLPCVLMIMLWLGTAAILFHDPLYLLHATGFSSLASSAPTAGAPGAGAGSAGPSIFQNAAWGVISHCVLIFPALVPFLGVLAARLVVKEYRIPGIFLAIFGALTPALDIYLNSHHTPFTFLRYQIVVIPWTFLIGLYVLRSLKRRFAVFSSVVALAMAAVLGMSNIFSAFTLSNADIAYEEAPVVQAIQTGHPVPPGGDYGALLTAPQTISDITKLDTDHGAVLCDSAYCFALNMAAPDPAMFVVTSDREFEGAASQPLVYHVEYFLVSSSANDRLNVMYPGLYQDGAGFGALVGDVSGGAWRLYRITGPTPRG